MVKCFISHSEKDKKIASKFVDFLRLGFEIERDNIFCSSYSGCDIKKGSDFVEYIREKLDDTKIVFALISYNFIQSAFCIAELGASWNSEKLVIPIMLDSEIKYTELTALFEHISATKITDKDGLMNIAEVIKNEQQDINIPNLNNKIDDLMAGVVLLKDEAQEPTVINYSEYKKKEDENKSLNAIIKNLRNKIIEKDKEIEQIKALKDKESIRQFEREKNNDSIKDFLSECEQIKKILSKQSKLIQLVIYRDIKHEKVHYEEIKNNCYDTQLKDAIDRKLIEEVNSGYSLNKNNKKVETIIKALDEFINYINSAPEDIYKYIEDEYELEMDIQNKEFWENCLDLHF